MEFNPLIVPGIAGAEVIETLTQVGALASHEFMADTQTFPPFVPALTVIEVVPCPLVIDQPEGTVQL